MKCLLSLVFIIHGWPHSHMPHMQYLVFITLKSVKEGIEKANFSCSAKFLVTCVAHHLIGVYALQVDCESLDFSSWVYLISTITSWSTNFGQIQIYLHDMAPSKNKGFHHPLFTCEESLITHFCHESHHSSLKIYFGDLLHYLWMCYDYLLCLLNSLNWYTVLGMSFKLKPYYHSIGGFIFQTHGKKGEVIFQI